MGIEVKFKGARYPVIIAPTHVPEMNALEVGGAQFPGCWRGDEGEPGGGHFLAAGGKEGSLAGGLEREPGRLRVLKGVLGKPRLLLLLLPLPCCAPSRARLTAHENLQLL